MIVSFKKLFSAKIIFIALAIMLCTHLLVLFLYVQQDRLVTREVKQSLIRQKILNAMHIAAASTTKERPKAIEALEDSMLLIELDEQPEFKVHIKQQNFATINAELSQHINSFSMSIQLYDGQWLNIHAVMGYKALYWQFALMIIEVLIAGLLLFYAWSISRFTKPLKDYKRIAERLGIESAEAKMSEHAPSLVRETTSAMNKMQRRISDLIQDRTRMLAAISHDLRTPITRMKLRVEFIEDEKSRADMLRDLDEMEMMTNDTLAFIRDDFRDESPVVLEMASFMTTLCDEYVRLGYHVHPPETDRTYSILGRPRALQRTFTNLVNNGIKYGDNVTINLKPHNKSVLICVEDDGPGLCHTDLDNIFKPFYRGKEAISKTTEGFGLGLAVSRNIILAHQGSITIENKTEGGLQVLVRLPLH